MPCIYGEGPEEEIIELIRGFLSTIKRGFKEKRHGRIYRFKIGLVRSILLIYYRSDRTFKICGKRTELEKFKEYVFINRRKIILYELPPKRILRPADPLEEQLFNLIIERQRIQRKICESIRSLEIAPLAFIVPSLVIYTYFGNPTYSIAAGTVAALLFTLMPRISSSQEVYETYFIPKLPLYRKRLKQLDKEITSLIERLPKQSSLRKIAELQIHGKKYHG